MIHIWVINALVVVVVVIIHYEFLFRMMRLLPKLPLRHRYRIVFGVGSALIAHAVEIWIFAFAYYLMHHSRGWGALKGAFDGSLLSCSYYSFTTFTTLGYGDIVPTGNIRYLTGIESLTGLVLITWTASFLYIEMQRYWSSQ